MGAVTDKPTKDEVLSYTTYTIFRTGVKTRHTYQLTKMVMGVELEEYWVELKNDGGVFCNCPGFLRQKFPAKEHKHVKIALDYRERGEPEDALYRIHGTGANAKIERIK